MPPGDHHAQLPPPNAALKPFVQHEDGLCRLKGALLRVYRTTIIWRLSDEMHLLTRSAAFVALLCSSPAMAHIHAVNKIQEGEAISQDPIVRATRPPSAIDTRLPLTGLGTMDAHVDSGTGLGHHLPHGHGPRRKMRPHR